MDKLENTFTLPPRSTDVEAIKEQTAELLGRLQELQMQLIATKAAGVLVILQGLDASGKDGAVKHVFSGMNPAGIQVHQFKAPTEEELGHDYLWRLHAKLPARGMIHIWNRSHYEDILVPTVDKIFDKNRINRRYKQINNWEQMLVDEGFVLLKFVLHVSREAQLERLSERQTDPAKRWKYQPEDAAKIEQRDLYLHVYDRILAECATAAPWHVVPADKNYYKHYCIAKVILEALKKLKMKWN